MKTELFLKVLLVITFIAAGCFMGYKRHTGTAILIFFLTAITAWAVIEK